LWFPQSPQSRKAETRDCEKRRKREREVKDSAGTVEAKDSAGKVILCQASLTHTEAQVDCGDFNPHPPAPLPKGEGRGMLKLPGYFIVMKACSPQSPQSR